MPPIESVSWRCPVAAMPIGTSCSSGCILSLMARVLSELPPVSQLSNLSVLRPIELALDPGADVARSLDLRQIVVEHELGDADCCRHFRLQNVGLAREQHAPRTQTRANLVGARLGRGDETCVGEP